MVQKARQTADQLTIELAQKNEEVRVLRRQMIDLEKRNEVEQIAVSYFQMSYQYSLLTNAIT